MASVSARKNPSGTITFRVNYREGGRQLQDSFNDPKEAQRYADMVNRVGGGVARQILDARLRTGGQIPTLAEYTSHYLDKASGLLTGVTERTRAEYQRMSERTFLLRLGPLPLDAITKQEVGRWVAWQSDQKASRGEGKVTAKSVKNYHSLLSSVLRSASEEGLIQVNAARGVKLPVGRRPEGVFLTVGELQAIIDHLPTRYHALVWFLVWTGCRWSEATALTWGDIPAESVPPTVRISKAWKRTTAGTFEIGPPKSAKSNRTVSLWTGAIAQLGKRGDPDELIFRNEDGRHVGHGNFYNRAWIPAVAASGIKKRVRVHDLRHTSASLLIAQGVPLPFIQARLGHEKITTTVDTYGHLVPDAHQEMAFAMQRSVAPKAISG